MILERAKLKKLLKSTKRDVLKHFKGRVSEIILFGSYAKGIANNNSDVDVLVLLQDENANFTYMEFGWELYDKCLSEFGVELHLLFEKKKYYELGCEEYYRDVPNYGKTIYRMA